MPESSIYHCYLDLIRTSQHYIYIENQFFISDKNRICYELVERINRAYREKKKFKVIIMMPLLPGFEGDITDESSSSVMRVQLYWEYFTLNRGKNSLYQKLSHIQNLDDYLKVYSLRQHGLTSLGIPVTEQLYIHSKLMIIDDQKVILGSANINDRSLLGDRDS
jgi:phospholipase D1/2